MKTRIIAVAIIKNNKDEVLILKMPRDRGVYPGQWGIVGGGMEDGEKLEETLAREVKEEVGLKIVSFQRDIFFDEVKAKKYSDGHEENIYMIYHLYECIVSGDVLINEEWDQFEWVPKEKLKSYDLNSATVYTFKQKGWL